MRMCPRYGSAVLCLLVGLSSGIVLAQDICDAAFAAAEEQYRQGDFDRAVSVLAPCMERPGTLEPEREKQVYRLLALAYIRRGDIDEAQLAVIELLSRHTDYEADPVADPPAYVSLVTLVRQRFPTLDVTQDVTGPEAAAPAREPPRRRRSFLASPVTWITVGGGAALATIIVLAGGGGGGGEPPPGSGSGLPLPPGLP